MHESTLTVGIGALCAIVGLVIGGGIGWGLVRAKLEESSRLIKAIFTKIDKIAENQIVMGNELARHDERIQAIRSDVRELRGIPTGISDVPSRPMTLQP